MPYKKSTSGIFRVPGGAIEKVTTNFLLAQAG